MERCKNEVRILEFELVKIILEDKLVVLEEEKV